MKFTKEQFVSLKEAYAQGQNLTQIIANWGIAIDFEVISFVYELQAGTYTLAAKLDSTILNSFTKEISSVMRKYLSNDAVILDCGTGESNTFIPILQQLNLREGIGIDSSTSRLTWAKQNAVESGITLKLAVADLGSLPLLDNSVDAVLTVHALEPNGGREYELITELGRVTKRFLFLTEPDFENATPEQQSRMDRLHYIRNLDQAIKHCDFEIVEKIPVRNNANTLNSASIIVVDTHKNIEATSDAFSWADPIFGLPLNHYEDGLINSIGLWYPSLREIRLLRESDTQYLLAPSN